MDGCLLRLSFLAMLIHTQPVSVSHAYKQTNKQMHTHTVHSRIQWRGRGGHGGEELCGHCQVRAVCCVQREEGGQEEARKEMGKSKSVGVPIIYIYYGDIYIYMVLVVLVTTLLTFISHTQTRPYTYTLHSDLRYGVQAQTVGCNFPKVGQAIRCGSTCQHDKHQLTSFSLFLLSDTLYHLGLQDE